MTVAGANWFIGFPVDATAWLAALEPVPFGARRFSPEDVHVTLAFLGPVGEAAARRAWELTVERFGDGARALGPWSFMPSRLHPFGDPRRPSAWSVEPDPRVEAVEAAIGAHRGAILEAGQGQPDRRPPRPHATLARPNRKAGPHEHRELRAWAERQVVPREAVLVSEVALFTWAAERRERLFEVVARCPLGQPSR